MKVIKAILTIILVLILLIAIAIGGLNIYLRTTNGEFFKTNEKEFIISGVNEGFVPQGVAFDENSGYYLVSGYMSDNSASRIYTIDPATSDFTYVETVTESGTPETIHAGGIAVYGRYVFVTTGTEKINAYRLSEVTDSDLSSAAPFATFTSQNIPESLSVYNDYIYIGEYYEQGTYDTPDNHHFENEAGEEYNAIALIYDITELVRSLSEGNTEALAPVAAYSVTDKAQGFCVLKGGQLAVTTSNKLKNSTMLIYDDPMKTNLTSDAVFEAANGEKVPLYFLDTESKLKEISLPPMAEEIMIKGDKVVVMNSFASNRSVFGKLAGAQNCRSFRPDF
ncbi:MAG: hypothetical protein IKT04_00190 [Clostridia bacterium]|nr:hypothetical protein [Clostridia bacterium]